MPRAVFDYEPFGGSGRTFDVAQTDILSGSLRPNHQIDIAIEHLQERQHLVDGLAIVCLIEQAIQLRCGSPEPTHNLALRQRTLSNAFLGFERQSVKEQIPEV